MPWKEKDGVLEKDQNGNPVWVEDGGAEKPCDFVSMRDALTKANKEAAERRQTIAEHEKKLKLFEGIENLETFLSDAKKNAETVANLDKDKKSQEEVTRARIEAATAPLQKQLAELEKSKADLVSQFHKALIDSKFGTSEYVNKELVNPVMVKELFGKYFSVNKDGKVIAKDENGTVLWDEHGEAAFDNALRELVAKSQYKNYVTKSTDANGSGAQNNSNNKGQQTDTSNMTSTQKIANGLRNNEKFKKLF